MPLFEKWNTYWGKSWKMELWKKQTSYAMLNFLEVYTWNSRDSIKSDCCRKWYKLYIYEDVVKYIKDRCGK